MESLVARAEAVARGAMRPEEDNMLKVTGDGRKAALDLRLVGLLPDPDGGKDRCRGSSASPRSGPISKTGATRAEGERPARCSWCSATSGPPDASGTSTTNSRPSLTSRGVPQRSGPLHARGQERPGEGRTVRPVPLGCRARAHRLDREDGDRHQRPSPRRGPAPSRLSVAAGRHRTTRRRILRQGNLNRRRGGAALCHRVQLRRLHVGHRRTQGRLHRPGDPGRQGAGPSGGRRSK